MEKGGLMFVTIKDVDGKSHVSPINLVSFFQKQGDQYARILYNNKQENILIDDDEHKRLKAIKDKEDQLLINLPRKRVELEI